MLVNVLQMMAVSRALAAFLLQLSGQSVVLLSNNATVVTSLWHQGSTVFRVLCCMAAEVVLWTERHSVSLTTKCTPGKKFGRGNVFIVIGLCVCVFVGLLKKL